MLLTPLLLSAFAAPALNGPDQPQPSAESSFVVDFLHIGDGRVLENAVITITDGKVSSVVGGGSAPDGATRLEGAHLTPGLVDAYSFMAVGDHTVEESRETTASLKLATTVNLDHPSFARAAAEGVTSAFLTPDTLNAFGGLAAMVKTAGGQPADLFASEGSSAKMVHDSAALKISLGNDVAIGNRTPNRLPNSYMIRRPTTRMGTVWTVRSTFYEAAAYARAREMGAAEYNADYEVLLAAMNGEIPIRVHARKNNDVQTALRLAQEFGWPGFVIEEGLETYKAAPLLAAAGIPVIAGPAFDDRSRSIATGPSIEEMLYLAAPPQICCEHLHEDSFEMEIGTFAIFPHHHDCEADAPATQYYEVERNGWGIPLDPNDPLQEGFAPRNDHDDHGHDHGHEEEGEEAEGHAHDHEHSDLNPMLPKHELVLDVTLRLGGERMARGLRSGRFTEGDLATPALPALLEDAGVFVALGGAEAHDSIASESSLIHQARRAVQYGMPREQALALVTSRSAALCGMGDRLGKVEVGFDADLVIWSGDPLENSSRPLLVLVDGEVVVDNR